MPSIIESKSVTINLWREAGIPEEHYILLVSSDLQARVRAEAAAQQVGSQLQTVRPDQEPRLASTPRAVVLDLDQLDDVAGWLRATGLQNVRLLGFFSHVRVEAGAAARAAGVEVYRRGRFWKQLPELLAELA